MKPKYTLEERRELKSRLKGVMMNHVGPSRKIGMGELYEKVFGEGYGHRINDTKMLRVFIDELQREGIRICSSRSNSNGGYWLAATATELNGYCDVLKTEIVHKASKVAALQRLALPDLLGQMALNLEHGAEGGEHGE
ncbi:MAG: hypothetical protein JW882_09985 [Deltaproteobacteria bacterium]|nr:hypothetical protein [Deltaproteobacteria bacterium]